jgi:nitroreductase
MMANTDEKTTPEYEQFRELFTRRMSMRDLRPDPVPDTYIDKILEAGRWAMSGANSQPWEFIVVRDPQVKQALVDAYVDVNNDFIFWMEQMRLAELRHPAFQVQGDPAEQWQQVRTRHAAWGKAPVLIVILGDGRRQWGTVLGAMTFGRHQSHLTDALSNAATLMSSCRNIARIGVAARHDPRPGAVQARARRARSLDDPPYPAGRLFRHRPPSHGPAPPRRGCSLRSL